MVSLRTEDYRAAKGLVGPRTGHLLNPYALAYGYLSTEIRSPLVVFWSYLATLLRLLCVTTATSRPRPPLPRRRYRSSQAWGITPPFPLVRVLSSTLLPGFIGPESSVLPVDLPPSVPPRFGFASSSQFSIVYGNLQRQSSRASLGKTHHLPLSRPASCQFGSPDIRSRLVTSARPPPQHHLAGSLVATYTGSASCFLQTPYFLGMPLPCWRCPSVR